MIANKILYEDIIKKIIFIPRKFHELKNISTFDLLKDSGYFQNFKNISKKSIYDVLKINSDCLNEWILYSEDKRTTSGYYFLKGWLFYIVGYYDPTKKNNYKKLFINKIKACADFIKEEIEETRIIFKF